MAKDIVNAKDAELRRSYNLYTVLQYKVCADIRGGSLERGRQTTVG